MFTKSTVLLKVAYCVEKKQAPKRDLSYDDLNSRLKSDSASIEITLYFQYITVSINSIYLIELTTERSRKKLMIVYFYLYLS